MSFDRNSQDKIIKEMMEEFSPLLEELREGIHQYSILYHKHPNDLLIEVVKYLIEE